MKLTDWLARERITQAEFGQRIRRDQAYISRICRLEFWPSADVMMEIRSATDGAVSADDFLPEKGTSNA